MTFQIFLVTFFIFIAFNLSEAQKVPAMFVFGDSLVDVGNNNHLHLSLAKADIPHYGLDFPTNKPNGRFTNGMNAADFLGKLIKYPFFFFSFWVLIKIHFFLF
jgi:hypothetical protein